MRTDIQRGETVNVVVHVADGVPPKRHPARVVEVLRQGVRVKFLDPGPHRMGERVVRENQVERLVGRAKLVDAIPQEQVSEIKRQIEAPEKNEAKTMEESMKKNGSAESMTEQHIAEGDYEIIETSRGEDRAKQLTVGSWWAPKMNYERQPRKDGSVRAADAYQVKLLIPKLPMNEVMLARGLQKPLSVGTILNNWDPVRLKKGCQPRTRALRKVEKPRGLGARLEALEEKVCRLMNELGLE